MKRPRFTGIKLDWKSTCLRVFISFKFKYIVKLLECWARVLRFIERESNVSFEEVDSDEGESIEMTEFLNVPARSGNVEIIGSDDQAS